jgi:hypothetical protein
MEGKKEGREEEKETVSILSELLCEGSSLSGLVRASTHLTRQQRIEIATNLHRDSQSPSPSSNSTMSTSNTVDVVLGAQWGDVSLSRSCFQPNRR